MAGKIERKRQITIETHSITIIRAKGKINSAYCLQCQQIVRAFSIEQTATIFQIGLNEVFQLIESGKFHSLKITGITCICQNSFNNSDSRINLK